jgi:serine/threonine-protein kinase
MIPSRASGEGRFLPGTLLGGRYRVIGLVGRGGMGEVYQATDLKLEQLVALKFLPEAQTADPTALARFSNEVRIARQVSHPNVCRVYDLGEVEGIQYIAMEYIDGENLASLLRRIGRVPADKALEMTRRLCAGLAAVHEKGILHRDLKPGNVMIDGSGQVRITDFGLAGLVEHFQPGERQSGTPQYMAPEQFEGRGASIQSDIYSLGLVLYELFTGRQPFEATPRGEPSHGRSTLPARPSGVVRELDPRTEHVILSCLAPDPRNRPPSARAIVAALPGGDPLAAAIAAGATPSPEMVGLSGGLEGLRMSAALACLIAVISGVVAIVALSGRANLFERVHLEKSPEVLAQEAGDWVRRLGYSAPPTDRAYGFAYANEALSYLEKAVPDSRRWSTAAAGHPSPLVFWYRESPRYLESSAFTIPPGLVSENNPYPAVSGMIGLTLDPRGRLLSFYAVPPQWEESTPGTRSDADATLIFDAAGFDVTRFAPSPPRWVPPVAFDSRRAWTGSYAEEPGTEMRLEAAYWRGRTAYFEVIGPWSKPERMQPTELTRRGQVAQLAIVFLFLALLAGGALFARHNVLAKRSDQRGAMRLAGFVFWLEMLLWCLGASHVPTLWEAALLVLALGKAAYTAGLTWLLYLGLEPFVRRRWPQTLISWTRVLSGRIRDPLVGAHILIGVVLGTGATLLFQAGLLWNHGVRLSAMAGVPSVTALLGGRHVFQQFVFDLDDAIGKAITTLFLVCILRLVVRSSEVAAALSAAMLTFLGMAWRPPGVTETGSRDPIVQAVIIGAAVALTIIALTRFGLLTTVTVILTTLILTEFPVTADLSSWYFGTAIAGLIAVLGTAAYGYKTAIAGRSWLGDLMLKE